MEEEKDDKICIGIGINYFWNNPKMPNASALYEEKIDSEIINEHAKTWANHTLNTIQNDLFDLGADIATPETDKPALRITSEQVTRLETEIDMMNAELDPLGSFILPGGSQASAWLHLARTVTRRAERHMTELAAEEVVNDDAMRYVNRLSDHLFVLARRLNENGKTDVLWRPGQNSGQK